jgi:hypothetical protein
MAWTLDARIPITLVSSPEAMGAALDGRPAALLAEGAAPGGAPAATECFEPAAAPHLAGCACCAGRLPAALALDRLFQARVRGQVGWFDRVVALTGTEAGRAEIAAALREDPLTLARYRLSA